jgi:hypothetical protein
LWLGASGAPNHAKLLAAQWFFIDQIPVQEIHALLPDGTCTRAELMCWLSDPNLATQAAFRAVYYSNPRLACYLLRHDPPLTTSELEAVIRCALTERSNEGYPPLNSHQLRVLLLRYHNGLLTEKIAQLEQRKGEEVESIIDELRRSLPFAGVARQLNSMFAGCGVSPSPLKNAGLYRRLAFQYFVSDQLPDKQVLERTDPVAAVGGYNLTDKMLNMWIHGGRLSGQLAKFVQGAGSCP